VVNFLHVVINWVKIMLVLITNDQGIYFYLFPGYHQRHC